MNIRSQFSIARPVALHRILRALIGTAGGVGMMLIGATAFALPATPLTARLAGPASPDMLTFRQWKTNRIVEAKAVLIQSSAELKSGERHHAEKSKIERLKHHSLQATHNFEVARDLTAHDYFVAYLTENFPNNPKALIFMVKHMTPSDTADILIQYQHALTQSQTSTNFTPSLPRNQKSVATSQLRPTLADFGGRLQEIKSMTASNKLDDDPIHERSDPADSRNTP